MREVIATMVDNEMYFSNEAIFNREKLMTIFRDFYYITKLRIAIWDYNYRLVMVYPLEGCKLCSFIRNDKSGAAACFQSDTNALHSAKKLGSPYRYKCHAALGEICFPIKHDGGIVGYAVFGQLITDVAQRKCVLDACARYNIPRLEELIDNIAVSDQNYIDAAANIMESLILKLRFENIIKLADDEKWLHICKYINEHLCQPLNIGILSDELYMSRSAIYINIREMTGLTVGEYITRMRLDRSCELLTSTNTSISEIAASVGIDDYNYYSRLFRKNYFITPSEYRKNHK